MNTLDDLHDSLNAYADRGDARGAATVLAAATADGGSAALVPAPAPDGGARWRLTAVAVAAAFLLVVGIVAAVRLGTDEAGVVTTPDPTGPPGTDPAGLDLAPITVPDGAVSNVLVAFERVWIATADPTQPDGEGSKLRSFDPASGDLLTEIAVPGGRLQVTATDGHLWVRTSLREAVGTSDLSDNSLLRVDPVNGVPEPVLGLASEGTLVAARDRVAVADEQGVTIVGEDGSVLGSSTVDEVVGAEGASIVSTSVITGLAFQPDPESPEPFSLFAVHAQRRELIELDPTTARFRTSRAVPVDGTYALGYWLVVSDGYVWVGSNGRGYGAPGRLHGARIPLREPEYPVFDRTIELDMPLLSLEPFRETRVVALTTSEVVIRDDLGVDVRTPLDGPLAPTQIVLLDGTPWVAQWGSPGADGTTSVTFVRVRTDASTPEVTSPTSIETTAATAPTSVTAGGSPAVLTIMTPQPLTDGQTISIAAAGLPAGADVTFSVCLPGDPAAISFCEHHVEPHPVPTLKVGVNAGLGELFGDWTVTRSVYDGTWHDCAEEACVLRVYPVDANGFRNTTTVLAEAPLTFAPDGTLLRPTLTFSPAGPITVGTTLTVTGSGFPIGAELGLTQCSAGAAIGSCIGDPASWELVVDADGNITTTYSIRTGGLGSASTVDCTAAPGACTLVVTPRQGGTEPLASAPLELSP